MCEQHYEFCTPNEVDAFECHNGPLLVRGNLVFLDQDGKEHRTRRNLSALCRCGFSAIKPWCDGSHKLL